jgi:ribokinase
VASVIVIGSINMDIVASAKRHPQLGETVLGTSLQFVPGGKGANQAVAAARSGAPTRLIANIGDDRFAQALTGFLSREGVDLSAVRPMVGVATGVAIIVVDGRGENSIVVVPGANAHLDVTDVEAVTIEPDDVVVAQLEVPASTVAAAFARARARGATTMLNATPVQDAVRELDHLVDVLVVNEIELSALTGVTVTPESSAAEIRAAISRLGHDGRAGRAATVVTLGARGVVATVGDRPVEVAGVPVDAVDSTGAGDCFVGVLAACLAAGDTIDVGLRLANGAASICVERAGAGPSMPSLDEIRDRTS